MEGQTKRPFYRVNRRLIPVKLIYLTSISAIGTLIPFIPVYMKVLGLSSTETGLLYGIMPFISFFTRPLIGGFADKIRNHKAVLIASLLSMGLFYGLLLITPSQQVDCKINIQHLSWCFQSKVCNNECAINRNLSGTNTRGVCIIRVACRGNLSKSQDLPAEFSCNSKSAFDCVKKSEWNRTTLEYVFRNAESFSKTFIIFFIIYLFATISFSSIYSLIDAMAYDILGDHRELWGRQRLWGTIGFALFALLSTFIVDIRSTGNLNSDTDFTISFYIFIGLCIFSAIISSRLKISESLQCKHLLTNVTHLFRYPEVVTFMIIITFIGLFFAVIQGFAFWYLKELGASQLTLGLCLLTNSIAEVAMFAFGGKIITFIGHTACLYIALVTFSLRFLSFSFLTNPLIAPLVELTHGVCFGLMYDAATEYASIISPRGMSATVQGLIGGLYFGFGRGIGGLVTGKLFDPVTGLGAVWTFRLYAGLSFTVLVVYIVVNTTIFRRPIIVPNMSLEIKQDRSEGNLVSVEENLFSAPEDT